MVEANSRVFDLSSKLDGSLSKREALDDTWAFVFDDGVFQRQANICDKNGLLRHLLSVEKKLKLVNENNTKATVSLYPESLSHLFVKDKDRDSSNRAKNKDKDSSPWDEQSAALAGHWEIRFSKKFSASPFEVWLELLLAMLAGILPCSDRVAGIVIRCRKGKTEVQLHMKDDPFEFISASAHGYLPESEQVSIIRDIAGVSQKDKNLRIEFRAINGSDTPDRSGLVEDKFKRARERREKKMQKRHTAPAASGTSAGVPDAASTDAIMRKAAAENPYALLHNKPIVQYDYTSSTPRTKEQARRHSMASPLHPDMPLEELVSLQFSSQELKLAETSDSDTITPNSSPREPKYKANTCPAAFFQHVTIPAPPPDPEEEALLRKRVQAEAPVDPVFEKRVLYYHLATDSESEKIEVDEVVPEPRIRCSESPSLDADADSVPLNRMVFGTNPPDLSAPLYSAYLKGW